LNSFVRLQALPVAVCESPTASSRTPAYVSTPERIVTGVAGEPLGEGTMDSRDHARR